MQHNLVCYLCDVSWDQPGFLLNLLKISVEVLCILQTTPTILALHRNTVFVGKSFKNFCLKSCIINPENLLQKKIPFVRALFVSSVLGILMTYLFSALAFASSICWLMSQLASVMFFLLHILIITLTFCPFEPRLMVFYFVQHDRLITQAQSALELLQ